MSCSFFPRITTKGEHCCRDHDLNYGPDTGLTRKEADWIFYQCMKQYHPYLAYPMYLAVRVFGWRFYKAHV